MTQGTRKEEPMMGAEGMAVSQVVVKNAGSSGYVFFLFFLLTDEDLPGSRISNCSPPIATAVRP
jgi:hypothetical protein